MKMMKFASYEVLVSEPKDDILWFLIGLVLGPVGCIGLTMYAKARHDWHEGIVWYVRKHSAQGFLVQGILFLVLSAIFKWSALNALKYILFVILVVIGIWPTEKRKN